MFHKRRIGLKLGIMDEAENGDLLRSSSKRSRGRILVSKGYHVKASHVSVNPSCRVTEWTKVLMFKERV